MTDIHNTNLTNGGFEELAEYFDLLPINARKAAQYFLHRIPDKRGRALDVGCGTGRVLQAMSPFFDEVYGIDISNSMLDKARARCESAKLDNVKLYKMDLGNMSFPSLHFDYIVSHTTLHHVADLTQALSEISRVLRIGGRTVIVDIISEGFTARWPRSAARMLAIVNFYRMCLCLEPMNALKVYRHGTSEAWLRHQAAEKFISKQMLIATCQTMMPHVDIRIRRGEMGLTHFAYLEWDKEPLP